MAHPALEFLRHLDPRPDARFCVETYTDAPKGVSKPRPDPLAARFPDKSLEGVDTLLPHLASLNARGAGVFVAVNQFNGQRAKVNLSRVRGVHADFDGVDETVLGRVRALLRPTIEVQTSGPRNWHYYWLLAGDEALEATAAESINRRLAQLGADRAAVDIAHLLRLPGFRHMKHSGVAQNAR